MIDAAVARAIRLVAFDVDGTMTDGGLWIGELDGRRAELKRFDIQDGMAVNLLRRAGLKVAMVTGRGAEASRLRAAELKVDEYVETGGRKLAAVEELLERQGVTWEHASFMGDDLIDIPVMRRVRLAVAVANAVPEVRDAAAFVTRCGGGFGAVREFAEALLKARGVWDTVVSDYLKERGDGS